MSRHYWRRYATNHEVQIALYNAASPAKRLSGAGFVAGDVQISADGGAFVNTAQTPSEIGSSGVYELLVTILENDVRQYVVTFKDNTSALYVEDEIFVDTYGDPSAEHPIRFQDHFLQVDIKQAGQVDVDDTWGKYAQRVKRYLVDDSVFTPTLTQFEANIADGGAPGADDVYIDRQVYFGNARGVLDEQIVWITDFVLDNGGGRSLFTTTPLVGVAVNNDEFVVV